MISHRKAQAFLELLKVTHSVGCHVDKPHFKDAVCCFSGEPMGLSQKFTLVINAGVATDGSECIGVGICHTDKIEDPVDSFEPHSVYPVDELESIVEQLVNVYQSNTLRIAQTYERNLLILDLPDIIADELELPRGMYGYLLENRGDDGYLEVGICVSCLMENERMRFLGQPEFDAMASHIRDGRADPDYSSTIMMSGEQARYIASRNA